MCITAALALLDGDVRSRFSPGKKDSRDRYYCAYDLVIYFMLQQYHSRTVNTNHRKISYAKKYIMRMKALICTYEKQTQIHASKMRAKKNETDTNIANICL